MNTIRKYNILGTALFSAIACLILSGCEKDLAGLEPATYPKTPEVFIDGFSLGLNYAAFGGSDVTAFDVDTEVVYEGTSSMKISVPSEGDAKGAYAGGVYFTKTGRDLSDYTTLTFWARASKAASIDVFGFGNDLGENRFETTITNSPITTNWQKYYIPIPDPSLLIAERGMFYFSEGPEDGEGYTFWVDEVQFENLGTIAHGSAIMQNGNDESAAGFLEQEVVPSGLSVTFNLPTGVDISVGAAPAYFDYESSNEDAVKVIDGKLLVVGTGNSVITTKIGDLESKGSLTVKGTPLAKNPTRVADDVISLFSDAYTNVPVNYYNGFWAPFQTTESNDVVSDDVNILYYTDFNFVGTLFSDPTVDASEMSYVHFDILVPGTIEATSKLQIVLRNFGDDGSDGGGDDTNQTIELTSAELTGDTWSSLDIPLTLDSKDELGLMIYESTGTTSITSFYVDNIYFYKQGAGEIATEPAAAAPTPTKDAAGVISIFSDAYTDLAGTDFNPDIGQSTSQFVTSIDGNSTIIYTDLDFAGIALASGQDVSDKGFLHLDYWTANSSSFRSLLVSTGPVEGAKTLTAPTNGEWTSIDIALTDYTGADLADIIQLKFDGNGDVYLDNIYFHGEAGGGGEGGGETNTILLDFESSPVQGDIEDFDGGVLTIISNPQSSGINTSGKVIEMVKGAGQVWAGSKIALSEAIDFSTDKTFKMKVYSPAVGKKILLKVENKDNGGIFHEEEVSSTKANEWEELTFDYSDVNTGNSYHNIVLIVENGSAGDGSAAFTYLMDDIRLTSDSGGGDGGGGDVGAEGPTEAAPTPTARDAADVISLFSNAYTNETVDSWSAVWDDSDIADETVSSNDVKKISFANFLGIDFSGNKFDASAMTHFHMDIWTPDEITDKSFNLKYVDFGGGGAENSAAELSITQVAGAAPALAKGTWVSIDVAINSAFTGTTTRSDMAQFVITSNLSTVYFDNLYFYK